MIPSSHRVAALFVQPDGCYAGMPDVDAWPEARDARTYIGPLPVVAHPPCATWGRYAEKAGGKGNDGGCFAAALASVRSFGGVIEHPHGSGAWQAHKLPGTWDAPDKFGGWTMEVHQRWWGHPAIKPSWLYLVGIERACPAACHLGGAIPLENLSKRQRAASPMAFARWLVELAAGANA